MQEPETKKTPGSERKPGGYSETNHINAGGISMPDAGFVQYGQSVLVEYWICEVIAGNCSIVHFPSD